MKLWLVYFSVCLVAVHAQSKYYPEYAKVPPEYPAPVPADKPSPATAPALPTSPASPPSNDLSCVCTLEFRPVCGSDGVTYGNPCQLACAQKKNPDLKKAHNGECEHKCPPPASTNTAGCACTKEFNPVCGSDGKTYGNVCVFCCAQRDSPELTIASRGECVDECTNKESCICQENYDPVCGSDGNTYNNTCLLCCMKDAGVLKEHDGPCDDSTCPNVEECLCSMNFDPVCGSDGITYNNTCLLCCHKGSGVTKVHDGPCVQNECPPPPKDSSCICPLIFLPVCGTDGKTYGNMCLLCCAQRKDSDLKKEHDGPCKDNYKREGGY